MCGFDTPSLNRADVPLSVLVETASAQVMLHVDVGCTNRLDFSLRVATGAGVAANGQGSGNARRLRVGGEEFARGGVS